MNEFQVIEQSKSGDPSAFAILMNRYKDRIYILASKFFHNASDREDVVQETFLRVYSNLHKIDASKGFSSWINRIGRNICIDLIRKRANYPISSTIKVQEEENLELQDLFLTNEKTPEEWLLEKERNEQLHRLLKSMSSKYTPLIYERYILEMSMEEIALSNNLPVNTVKSRLHRARTYLHNKWVNDSRSQRLTQ